MKDRYLCFIGACGWTYIAMHPSVLDARYENAGESQKRMIMIHLSSPLSSPTLVSQLSLASRGFGEPSTTTIIWWCGL